MSEMMYVGVDLSPSLSERPPAEVAKAVVDYADAVRNLLDAARAVYRAEQAAGQTATFLCRSGTVAEAVAAALRGNDAWDRERTQRDKEYHEKRMAYYREQEAAAKTKADDCVSLYPASPGSDHRPS